MSLLFNRDIKQKGSALVESALIYPLVIAVAIMSITCANKLFLKLKSNVETHIPITTEQYERFEKGRLYVGIYCHDFFVTDVPNDNLYFS